MKGLLERSVDEKWAMGPFARLHVPPSVEGLKPLPTGPAEAAAGLRTSPEAPTPWMHGSRPAVP